MGGFIRVVLILHSRPPTQRRRRPYKATGRNYLQRSHGSARRHGRENPQSIYRDWPESQRGGRGHGQENGCRISSRSTFMIRYMMQYMIWVLYMAIL